MKHLLLTLLLPPRQHISISEVKVDKVQVVSAEEGTTFDVCLDQDEKKFIQSVTRYDTGGFVSESNTLISRHQSHVSVLMVGFDLQVRGVSVLQSRKQFRLEVLQALTWPSPAPAPVLLLSALPAHHLFLRLVPVTHFFYRAQRIHGADIEQFTQGCSIQSKSWCRIYKLDREGK